MPKILTPRKTAVFGGKFDPPHLAHQLIIFLLLEKYGMNEVWIVPSYDHPFGMKPSDFEIRCEMCAFLAKPWHSSGKVKIVTEEKELKIQPVYTVDLLKHFLSVHNDKEFYLVIGEDNWNLREKWKDFDTIEKIAKIIVIGRGNIFDNYFPLPDISSSLIRKMIQSGKSPDHLLPAGLVDFIRDKRLYF